MSTALEAASLIMIPSGYEDGTLASVKPTDGTGDFTFTRCDGAAECDLAATRVNADGYIEKGYENLLTYSNTFSDFSWTKFNASVTGGQVGYDGTNDAWLLERNETFGQVIQNITNSGVQTFSVYAKANSLNWIRVTQGSPNAYFDLSGSGAVGQVTQCIDATIESIGGGWFKCSITSNVSLTQVRVYLANGDNDLSGTTGSIYIQDAMLNQGLVAYPYIETTTAPVAGGILEDMPRLDYSNGSCPALLLEPQRTNLVPYSEYITSNQGLATIEYNGGVSPEGVSNAIRVVENTSTSFHTLSSNATISNTNAHTLSVFVKTDGVRDTISLRSGVSTNIYTSSVFTLSGSGSYAGSDGGIESYGNGWYRIYWTFSHTQTGTSTLIFNGSYYAGTGQEWFFYGAQLEQDASYPTSYIPTYGVSQTRLVEILADDIDIGSFTSTSNTLFFDWGDMEGKSTFNRVVVKGLATTDNSLTVFRIISLADGRLRYQVYSSESGNEIVNYTCTTRDKVAFVLNGLNSKLFINGSLYATYTIDVPQGLRKLIYNGGSRNVTNQFTIFPTALTDSECIELTTI